MTWPNQMRESLVRVSSFKDLLVEEETFSKRLVGTNLHFTSVGANKAAVRPGSGVPSRCVGLPVTEISSAWAGRGGAARDRSMAGPQVRTEAEAGPPAPTPHHPVPAAFPPHRIHLNLSTYVRVD